MSRRSGFSLLEVTLAIGIIAFAFVALLGLIPSGLQVFRESIDTANEMWIMQNMNSMVQVTPWKQVKNLSKWTFYFDEEGRLTDKEGPDAASDADQEVKDRRIYAVKLIFGDPIRPGDGPGEGTGVAAFTNNVSRVVAVIAPCLKPKAMQEFASVLDPDDVRKLKKGSSLRTRAFVVSRMDSMMDRENATFFEP